MFVLVATLRCHCLLIYYLCGSRSRKLLLCSSFSVHTIPYLLLPAPYSSLLPFQKPLTNTDMHPSFFLFTFNLYSYFKLVDPNLANS